jgi:hypothetical protein
MALSGMAGLLKSMGVDTDDIQAQATTFMQGMKAQADTINANQQRIEKKLDEILGRLDAISPAPSTREILENDAPTGVLITDEKFPQAMIDDVNGKAAEHGGDGTH